MILFFVPALIAGVILVTLISIQIFLIRRMGDQVNKNYMQSKALSLETTQKSILAIQRNQNIFKRKSVY